MRIEIGNPVPYDATAVRPTFMSLPPAVREEIIMQLHGEPVEIRLAGGGFTGGFAARLVSASGRELFVKAAGPQTPFVVNAYSYEAHNNRALPPGMPAPALRFSSQVGEWVVLGFEAVDGQAVTLPMRPDDLDLLLATWARAAEKLTPAPPSLRELGVVPMPTDRLTNFASVAAGDTTTPDLPGVATDRIHELAELEHGLANAIAADAVIHGDLRPDNTILGDGQAWICDWTMLNIAAPWFDTVAFLVLAHGDGHDAERLFWQHPTSAGVDGEQLDAVLAAIAGYYLCNAEEPLIERVSPLIRRHQRWNGLATLDWLATRRRW